MGAREIAGRLSARRSGRGWVARCPAHADRHPSLSITEAPSGKVRLKCFAGCPATNVFAALSRTQGGGIPAELSAGCLITPPKDPSDIIERIWSQGRPISGSIAARYLSARGLSGARAEALRFHPRLRHPTSTYWPGMIARAAQGLTGEC